MTTIITRLYPDAATAKAVAAALHEEGMEGSDVDILTAADAAAITAARVAPAAAAAYAGAMGGGKALLVARAPFAPMGLARAAIQIADAVPSLKVGVRDENDYVREEMQSEFHNRVLTSHPYIMSNKFRKLTHGRVFSFRALSHPRPRTSAIRGGAYISTKFWPMPLISGRNRSGNSVMRSGWSLSRMFGLPTIAGRLGL